MTKTERDLLLADVEFLRGWKLHSDSPEVAALFRLANAVPRLLALLDDSRLDPQS